MSLESATVIWPGAKWVVAGLSGILSAYTIPAVRNQLEEWKIDGWITFFDAPAMSSLDYLAKEQSTLFGGMMASWVSYLFAKTFAPSKTFPSFLIFTLAEVNILPWFWNAITQSLQNIFKFHWKGAPVNYISYFVLSYCTFVSMYFSELSKIPLL